MAYRALVAEMLKGIKNSTGNTLSEEVCKLIFKKSDGLQGYAQSIFVKKTPHRIYI